MQASPARRICGGWTHASIATYRPATTIRSWGATRRCAWAGSRWDGCRRSWRRACRSSRRISGRRRRVWCSTRAWPAPANAVVDRAAVAAFGILSQGAHLNGLVRRADGLHLWIGWRSRHKALAPGQMDNIVAGGVPAGLSPHDTLLKEAEEEARMPAALAARAKPVGRVSYVMDSPGEGLRRDILHCFDIELPEDFTPEPGDDEVERFELWPAARVLEAVRDGDRVKFNVNLVLIDLFLREGLAEDPDGRLRQGLDRFR
ncbi:MAG: NUDIX domain-containing protein [Acetobacteraceae bacterium]|nr:NUDIX domain-containing protein [Acetobacteraceae bacterium]